LNSFAILNGLCSCRYVVKPYFVNSLWTEKWYPQIFPLYSCIDQEGFVSDFK